MDDQVPDFTGPPPLPDLLAMHSALEHCLQMTHEGEFPATYARVRKMLEWVAWQYGHDKDEAYKMQLVCQAASETTFIETMLVLSTGHIKKKTADWLANHAGLFKCPIGIENLEYGWMLYMPTASLEMPEVPEELEPIIDLALKLGTRKVLLDQDGETYPDLPTYDWE